MTSQQRVHALLAHGLDEEAVAAILDVELADIQRAQQDDSYEIPVPEAIRGPAGVTGAAGAAGAAGATGAAGAGASPARASLPTRTLNVAFTPGDGTHPTLVVMAVAVTCAPGQAGYFYVVDMEANGTTEGNEVGSVVHDRSGAAVATGDEIVGGTITMMVPAGKKLKAKFAGTAATRSVRPPSTSCPSGPAGRALRAVLLGRGAGRAVRGAPGR
jgi:hypothetical protein